MITLGVDNIKRILQYYKIDHVTSSCSLKTCLFTSFGLLNSHLFLYFELHLIIHYICVPSLNTNRITTFTIK